MRYPLPYAFARGNQLLLEDDGNDLTLWHAAAPMRGAHNPASMFCCTVPVPRSGMLRSSVCT